MTDTVTPVSTYTCASYSLSLGLAVAHTYASTLGLASGVLSVLGYRFEFDIFVIARRARRLPVRPLPPPWEAVDPRANGAREPTRAAAAPSDRGRGLQ